MIQNDRKFSKFDCSYYKKDKGNENSIDLLSSFPFPYSSLKPI